MPIVGPPVSSEPTPWITAASSSLSTDPRLVGVTLPSGVTLDMIAQAATDKLHRDSGRQFQLRTDTVRPHRVTSDCGCGGGVGWGLPAGDWGAASGCGCAGSSELLLRAPVVSVGAVTVEGVVLAPTEYVLDHDRLIRVATPGGPGVWHCCQDLTEVDGGPGTWSVVYTWGVAPPTDGVLACRALSIEIALMVANKMSRMAEGETLVSASGTISQIANASYMNGGLSRIPLVDQFLLSANPHRLQRRPTCSSPDSMAT